MAPVSGEPLDARMTLNRLLLLVAATLTMMGCAHTLRPCSGADYPLLERRDLARRVSLSDVRREYLAAIDAAALPTEPRRGVEKWIDDQVNELRSKDPGWPFYYRHEKCCGWYREGYAAVRNGCIVGEINTREDM
jgi:hypothetical protein